MSVEEFNNRIRDMVTRGNLTDLDGFVFPGDVDFSAWSFHASMSFKNARFTGAVALRQRVSCQVPLSFESATFAQGLDISGSHFNDRLDFSQAEFHPKKGESTGPTWCLNASNVHLYSGANFSGSRFIDDDVLFTGANLCDALFRSAHFRSSTKRITIAFGEARLSGRFICIGIKVQRGDLDFSNTEFDNCSVVLKNAAIMEGAIHVVSCKFTGSELDLGQIELHGGEVGLAQLTLVESNVSFEAAEIVAEQFSMHGIKIDGGALIFDRSRIECPDVDFTRIEGSLRIISFDAAVIKGDCRFRAVNVTAKGLTFDNTTFGGPRTQFSDCDLMANTRFRNNNLSGRLEFVDVRLSRTCTFHLTNPAFDLAGHVQQTVVFRRVMFSPYLTFFEQVRVDHLPAAVSNTHRPLVAFRYCLLKDVYFSANDMSLFSFYTSAFFEDSIFTSSDWTSRRERIFPSLPGIPLLNSGFNRKFIIREETELDQSGTQQTSDGDDRIEMPTGCEDVAELYLRMKSSADKAKDYQRASWFYFNEFEMKRNSTRDVMRDKTLWARILCSPRRKLLYDLYKLFAGYGEKPAWSVTWFFGMTIVFAFLHIFNGLKLKDTQDIINYDLCLPWNCTGEFHLWGFLSDLCTGAVFAVSRTLPLNYLPGTTINIMLADSSNWSFVLSALNSVVLILLVVLIGVGFKRHFRRF